MTRTVDTPSPSRKPSATKPVLGAYNAAPATFPIKANPPVNPVLEFWFEADGGIYGFSKNLPVLAVTAPPGTTGPTFLPNSPGFIGLVTTSTVTNPLISGNPALLGGGGNFRMGYWLDPARTMAVDGSAFFVKGSSSFDFAQTTVVTRTFDQYDAGYVRWPARRRHDDDIDQCAISDQLYGADLNYPHES